MTILLIKLKPTNHTVVQCAVGGKTGWYSATVNNDCLVAKTQ